LVASTVTVESYITVCPSNTTLVVPGPKETATYTATASQTVTVTNGPFTTPTLVPTTSIFTPTAPAASQVATTVAPAGTAPAVASSGFGVAPKPSSTAKPFTGAASKFSGAGVAGLLGFAAYIL